MFRKSTYSCQEKLILQAKKWWLHVTSAIFVYFIKWGT